MDVNEVVDGWFPHLFLCRFGHDVQISVLGSFLHNLFGFDSEVDLKLLEG